MTALMESSGVMYTSGMADAPDLPKELPINEARNQLGKVIERARYFGGVTYLLNRGKRVAAVAPAELGELSDEFGGPDKLIEFVRAAQKSQSP